ncbi:unnamed protein product [Parajaminaea phylloscopi]
MPANLDASEGPRFQAGPPPVPSSSHHALDTDASPSTNLSTSQQFHPSHLSQPSPVGSAPHPAHQGVSSLGPTPSAGSMYYPGDAPSFASQHPLPPSTHSRGPHDHHAAHNHLASQQPPAPHHPHLHQPHPHHYAAQQAPHHQAAPTTLAAPRAVPPYPRFTSPQPGEHAAQSPSPSKRGAAGGLQFGSVGPHDVASRDRRAGPSFDVGMSSHAHSDGSGGGMGPGAGANGAAVGPAQDSFFSRGPAAQGSGGNNGGLFAQGRPSDRSFGAFDSRPPVGPHRNDFAYPAAMPAKAASANQYAHSQGHFEDAGSSMTSPSHNLSPRSLMGYGQGHQAPQQPAPYSNNAHNPSIAHSLGSGLMSNSGQPAEEITTVFIVGFPDDMTEREFANMFLFARGFEASTLKVPVGGVQSGPAFAAGNGPARSAGGGSGGAGEGGPYNAVNVPGGSLFEMASNGGWDEQSINAALSRNDAFALANMNNALGGAGSIQGSLAAANAAGKIKQIIGFAKFRTRAEALEARDALNGKKIDAERGCVLKTEMAKKNLHTKQRPALSGPGAPQPDGGVQPAGVDRERAMHAQPPPPMQFGMAPSVLSPSERSSGPSSHHANFPHSMSANVDPQFGRTGGAASNGFVSPTGPYPGEPFAAPPNSRNRLAGSDKQPDVGFAGRLPTSSEQGPRSADTWPSLGPIDYFGPSTDGGMPLTSPSQPPAHASQSQPATSRQHREGSGGSSLSSSQPRGPDWSALGSPPGLFTSARTFAPSETGKQSERPFQAVGEYGEGVPIANTQTRGSASGSISSISSAGIGGGSSPTKVSPSSQGSEGETMMANYPHLSRSLSGSTDASTPLPHGSSFASRFGSLRLEPSSAISTANSSAQAKAPGTDKGASGSNKGDASALPTAPGGKPIELPSPTSRSFSIDQNPPGNTLFVGNLPGNISSSASAALEEQLRQRFQNCNGYRQLSYRVKNNGPMCFVEFEDVQSAARALAEVNGESIGGTVKNGGLRLSFSKNPLFRNSSSGTATIGGPAGSMTPTDSAPSSVTTPRFDSLGKAAESMRSDDIPDPLDAAGDLEETSYRDGFSAGHAHGKLHGTFEGRQLGREKGFEIWDEVGFYEGTARFWRGVLGKQVESIPAHLRSRKQVKQLQHLSALETLIGAFPTKNNSASLPQEDSLNTLSKGPPTPGASATTPAADSEELEDPQALAQLDMTTLLERIRARYKVVCASLGIPARAVDAAGGQPPSDLPDGKDASDAAGPGAGGSNSAPGSRTAVIGGKIVDTTQLRF